MAGPQRGRVRRRGHSAKREEAIRSAIAVDGWAIVNWEQLRVERKRLKTRNGGERTVTQMKQPLFETTPWLAVIADEAHRAKNRKASQSMGLHRIDANLMIAATGTPIMNSPDELWSLLKWMWPKEYTSYWRFYDQYVEYHESYYGKVITGVKIRTRCASSCATDSCAAPGTRCSTCLRRSASRSRSS